MKKTKLTSLILSLSLCLIMCVSVFAGCTLVTTDMSRYYSEVVATLDYEDGERIEITKRDLSIAVANYGSYYMQNYGMSGEEAIRQLLEMVINEKLIIRDAEKLATEQNGGDVLTTKEKTYLWETTYETIEDNIISYYNEINGITEEDQEEDSTDGVVSQTIYEIPVSLQMDSQGKHSLVLETTPTTEVEDHVYWNGQDRDLSTENDLDALYKCVRRFLTDSPEYAQGYSRYLSEAKSSEQGMGLSTDNESVFKREIQRVYGVLYDSFMIDKYAEINQTNNSSVTIENILNLYESKVTSDYNKYMVEGATTYESDILEDAGNVYYFKETGSQFFYVSHVLAKFSDKEQAIYDECQNVLNGTSTKYTIQEAQSKIEDLYTNLAFPAREKNEDGDWVETGETKSVSAVLQEIQLKLATAGDNEQLKAEYFDEFVYKYNEDEGIMNAERNYVIGVDYTTPDTENDRNYTVYSNMVDSFTNAAIELYNYGNAKVGDLYAEPIRSDYGIHIMVFEGKVQNVFTNIDSNFKLSTSDIAALSNTRLKAGEEKTLLHELFDELNSDRYSLFENMNIQFLRDEVQITRYPDAYKDLY